MNLSVTSNQMSRIGVGQLDAVMNGKVPWVKIPTYYYDYRHLCLPLTTDECEAFFDDGEIPIFMTSTTPNRFTNAAIGSGVNETFLALGAGVIAIGEGQSFTIHGAAVAKPSSSQTAPAITGLSLCENYCGAVDLSESEAGASHATFWWGGPTWRVIEKFFQSYRLVIRVIRRFEIVNESLFDVGMTPTPPEFVGASDSFIPTMPFIRATNDIIQARDEDPDNVVFMPPNKILGQFSPTQTTESICLAPPIAPVTWGHPRIIGLANRMYCFGTPILFLPGMTFDVVFQQAAEVCHPDICEVATIQRQTPDSHFTTGVSGITNCGESFTFPGGSIDLGVVFKGFALWPSAAVKYISSYIMAGSTAAQVVNETGQMNNWLQSAMNQHDKANPTNAPLNPGMTARGVLSHNPENLPQLPPQS
jgi:hypothetical protein